MAKKNDSRADYDVVRQLLEDASLSYQVPMIGLLRSRKQELVDARKAIIYVLTNRDYLGWKLKRAAGILRFHHATLIHHRDDHQKLIDSHPEHLALFNKLLSQPATNRLIEEKRESTIRKKAAA